MSTRVLLVSVSIPLAAVLVCFSCYSHLGTSLSHVLPLRLTLLYWCWFHAHPWNCWSQWRERGRDISASVAENKNKFFCGIRFILLILALTHILFEWHSSVGTIVKTYWSLVCFHFTQCFIPPNKRDERHLLDWMPWPRMLFIADTLWISQFMNKRSWRHAHSIMCGTSLNYLVGSRCIHYNGNLLHQHTVLSSMYSHCLFIYLPQGP